MSKIVLDEGLIRDIAEAHDGEARNDYSGPRMYGDTCLGVTFNSLQDFLGFYTELVTSFPYHADQLGGVLTDGMGLGTIYYWPGIKVVGDDWADCRFCDRRINFVGGLWVDPEATGDDAIWWETCDSNHEDRIAAHEPVSNDG